jgi:sugar (pentulose or hexulose) kinase
MAKPILILDLGSSSVRAFVISSSTFEIIGRAKYEVSVDKQTKFQLFL